ncbi:MAG: hypothetical protein GF398_04210 [Chitinivibrionales bacterium]|nr:hypothetical protein [Chitinivibrionales bacterium]
MNAQQIFLLVALPLMSGGALGAAYFSLLWFEIRRLPRARHPRLNLAGGFFLRLLCAGCVFSAIAVLGHWYSVLFALAGFSLVRLWSVLRMRQIKPVRATVEVEER